MRRAVALHREKDLTKIVLGFGLDPIYNILRPI
jgi:hypothetical protein